MMFYRRYTHVAEIQMGTPALRLEDACAPDHFDVNKLPYITLLASNPDSEICPLDGSYALRGAIGPPLVTSRHKRNHSNRNHTQHRHHDNGSYQRHSALSFRNSEEIDKQSWHGSSRGISTRNRRSNQKNQDNDYDEDNLELYENSVLEPVSTLNDDDQEENDDEDDVDDLDVIESREERGKESRRRNLRKILDEDYQIRRKRDIQPCVVNYNANRQLLVGCTQQNVIDVRPQCIDDGDEGKLT